jgi:hypothetical protein
MAMEDSALSDLVTAFNEVLALATTAARQAWSSRKTVDLTEYILDVLFLRNAEAYDALMLVLREGHTNAAEFLLRPLLEGVVIFEWCMQDPHSRALRFKRTCFESTLELIHNGYLTKPQAYVEDLQVSIAWFDSKGHKHLPDMRQMVDSVSMFKANVGYNVYKLLAKKAHGLFENWPAFDPTALTPRTTPSSAGVPSSEQHLQLSALAGYLQMRNLFLVSAWDPTMASTNPEDLEEVWAQLYRLLERHEARGE